MIVGPARLPKLLGTLGRWSAKLRRITTEVRYQSGIDDILRKEGITGGLSELRNLRNAARGGLSGLASSAIARPPPRAAATQSSTATQPSTATESAAPLAPQAQLVPQTPLVDDPFADVAMDPSREYPVEGCDAYSALPDDMWRSKAASAGEAVDGPATETKLVDGQPAS
jgi:sec-independent protein translocase protein TatB